MGWWKRQLWLPLQARCPCQYLVSLVGCRNQAAESGPQVGETPELQHLLAKLQERVAVELRTQTALLRVMGMLEPIVASAT